MIRSLSLDQVLAIHEAMIQLYGGSTGIRDRGLLESAIAQPFMSFCGAELYPDLAEKAAALCYSLVRNHPFVDGNKRVGLGALIVFAGANDSHIDASTDEKEAIILGIADGSRSRSDLVDWIRSHLRPAGR